jgi:alpha-D-ribose 1-methylphosphonate 5-phosphate C-P lyase
VLIGPRVSQGGSQWKQNVFLTSNLIAQSRKIIESGQDDTTNSNTLLNIILQIVTSIDTRVQRMETNIEKRIDDLNQSML